MSGLDPQAGEAPSPRWLAAAVAHSLLIAAVSLCARPWAEALRARGALQAGVLVAGALAALALALIAGRRPVAWSAVPRGATGATVLAYGVLATWWGLPEEQMHLVLYAPLGALLARALPRPGLAAAALLTLGLGDELLQGALPARHFDPWDVVANGVAGLAAMLLVRGGRGAWAAPASLLLARAVLPLLHPAHPGLAPGVEAPALGIAAVSEPVDQIPAPRAAIATAPFAGRDVLLVTVDALRADAVPPWGSSPVPLPAFERLAAGSLTPDGVANALWTTPSMVSLLTGLHPAVHGVAGRGLELQPGIRTPLEALAEAGWTVAGYAGDATETYRNLGIGAEIDRSDPLAAIDAVLAPASGSAFLWLHLRQVHAPYDSSAERLAALGLDPWLPDDPYLQRVREHPTIPSAELPGDHRWLRPAVVALYQAEVADADAALGGILDRIDALPEAARPVLIVTADHGEELLERGAVGHASTTLASSVQPELVRIPLYLWLPGIPGRRVAGVVEQIDLMPTLLPWLGVDFPAPRPGWAPDGRDLGAALLAGTLPAVVPLVSSSPCGWQCPPERRGERVHGLVLPQEPWPRCGGGADCPPELRERLEGLKRKGAALQSPVTSP